MVLVEQIQYSNLVVVNNMMTIKHVCSKHRFMNEFKWRLCFNKKAGALLNPIRGEASGVLHLL